MGSTSERFARIEAEFAARDRLSSFGLRPRKTILLYGPPGCGKSLGAKRLAWQTGLPLMKVRFDALISSYFGESASNLRSIFVAAQERPCVLLLDECDFIARSRANSKDIGEVSRIVNTLLQLMEDYDAPGLLVATTNIESSLDSALFRRFDDVFLVPLPGPEEIERLLKLTLSAVRIAEPIDWVKLVHALEGASAAMVVRAAQNAAKASVLSGKKELMQSALDAVMRHIVSPRTSHAVSQPSSQIGDRTNDASPPKLSRFSPASFSESLPSCALSCARARGARDRILARVGRYEYPARKPIRSARQEQPGDLRV